MSGEIESLGAMITAGITADALEPPTGLRVAAPVVPHGSCANCETPLAGNFCAACGQRAHLYRSLADVGHEFIHGITHFDGKAWKTLPMLVFRPGRLTREYIMGKRARYIAPVPLFLLVVFLMFFVFSFVGFNPGAGSVGSTGDSGTPMTKAEALNELPKVEAELRDIDKQVAQARAKGGGFELPGLLGARAGVVAARDAVKARAEGRIDNPVDLPGAIAEELGAAAKDGKLEPSFGFEELNKKARKALKNPELALYKIQGKAYKFSFLLVPLSLPWLWLMFAWKRDVRMYDHAVFSLYSISFMSLLFVLGSIVVMLKLQLDFFWFLLVFVAPVTHMFFQLKGTYSLRNFGAAWRTVALGFASLITLSIYAALMIAIGLLD